LIAGVACSMLVTLVAGLAVAGEASVQVVRVVVILSVSFVVETDALWQVDARAT
jgi:hypothetical protein